MSKERLRRNLGHDRADGVMRVFPGLPFVIAAIVVIYPALIFAALVRSAITIPAGILRGEEIEKDDEPVGRIIWGLWMWTTDNSRWVLTGAVGPKSLPSFDRP